MFVRNFYEPATSAKEIKFEYVENQIKNPNIYEDKNSIPLIFGYNFKNSTSNKENVIGVQYLILDYEKSKSIEDFVSFFSKYKFYLYTSYRHTETQHRFRVIIPLDREYSVEEYLPLSARIKAEKMECVLSKYFQGVDKSCFGVGFAQRVPAQTDEYRYVINDGELFSFSQIPQKLADRFRMSLKIQEDVEKRKKTNQYRSISTYTEKEKIKYFEEKQQAVINELSRENTFNWSRTGTGQGTDSWLFRAASSLVKCRMDEHRIISTLLTFTNGRRKREIEHKVKDAIRKAN